MYVMSNQEKEGDVSKFVSPDGKLTFLVIRDPKETSLGFEGVPSHTHGDMLAEHYGVSEDEAIRVHLDALLNNRLVIAIATVDGRTRDIWTTDKIEHDKYKPANEIITYRHWNGTVVGRQE